VTDADKGPGRGDSNDEIRGEDSDNNVKMTVKEKSRKKHALMGIKNASQVKALRSPTCLAYPKYGITAVMRLAEARRMVEMESRSSITLGRKRKRVKGRQVG